MQRWAPALLASIFGPAFHASAADAQSPASTPASPLQFRAALSHSGFTETTRLLLKVEYLAHAATSHDRPAVNIALVVDSSNSMAEGQKVRTALRAAGTLIESLSPRDIVSLVAVDHAVTVLSPAGRTVNKPFLFHRLEDIAPRGYTDLSAGLLEGIAQVRAQTAEGQKRHVLLLTDGRANRGVTETAAMMRLAEKAHASGISVSTLACGPEMNEANLTALAKAGGGRYIRLAEEVLGAFGEDLRDPRGVVAQNVRLEIAAAGGHIAKVNGQPASGPRAAENLKIGNLRAGQRGLFLIELKPSSFAPGTGVKLSARLTFDDLATGQRVIEEAHVSAAPAGPGEIKENAEVVLYGEVLNALTLAEEGAKGMDAERAKLAQTSFSTTYGKAREFALAHKDQELLNQTFLLKHFVEEITAASERGLLHEHVAERAKFSNDADYRRYLLNHHRSQPTPNRAVRD